MVLFPAFVHLADLASQLSGSSVSWGGQTCHMAEKGAHTGDISAAMLADMGASWCCWAILSGGLSMARQIGCRSQPGSWPPGRAVDHAMRW